MIRLHIDNQWCWIQGADRKLLTKLDKKSSYFVAGAYFVPAFKSRQWDGREHLLKMYKGRYRIPIGMFDDVCQILEDSEVEYEVSNKRHRNNPPIQYQWNEDIVLRHYQKSAVDSIVNSKLQSGILKLAIRSGKTLTSARIIHDLQCRALFLVPDLQLLYQTQKEFADVLCMDSEEIGIIGDGKWREGDRITIATFPTLVARCGGERMCSGNLNNKTSKPCKCGRRKCSGRKKFKIPRKPEYTDLLKGYDLVITDECHHQTANKWRDAIIEFKAPFRVGLSATVFLENTKENERGVIWLKALCGGVRHEIKPSQLIKEGYLVKPHIWIYKIDRPDKNAYGYYSNLLNDTIFNNEYRNRIIAKVAKDLSRDNIVLIVSRRIDQVNFLKRLCDEEGIEAETLTGRSGRIEREVAINRFRNGEVRVLIGTVLREGVNIPEVEVVINAEGGRDLKTSIQRMRNLTPSKGKKRAIFVDFADMTSSYTAQHSLERIECYKSEEEFVVKLKRLKR